MIWRIIIGAGAGFLFLQLCAVIAINAESQYSRNFVFQNEFHWLQFAIVAVGGLMGFAWHQLKQET